MPNSLYHYNSEFFLDIAIHFNVMNGTKERVSNSWPLPKGVIKNVKKYSRKFIT